MNKKFNWFLAPALSLLALVVDRVSKYYFVTHQADQISLIDPVLYLEYSLNSKMALSLPLVPIIYYSLITVVLAVLVVLFYRAVRERDLFRLWIILFILVGAISNLFDRLWYGGVVDFITVSFWSIFNLADAYIVVAIIIWFIKVTIDEKKYGFPKT